MASLEARDALRALTLLTQLPLLMASPPLPPSALLQVLSLCCWLNSGSLCLPPTRTSHCEKSHECACMCRCTPESVCMHPFLTGITSSCPQHCRAAITSPLQTVFNVGSSALALGANAGGGGIRNGALVIFTFGTMLAGSAVCDRKSYHRIRLAKIPDCAAGNLGCRGPHTKAESFSQDLLPRIGCRNKIVVKTAQPISDVAADCCTMIQDT